MPATLKKFALVRIDDQTGTKHRIEAGSDEYDDAEGHLLDVLNCDRISLRMRLLMTLTGKPVAAAGAKWKFAE